MARSLYNNSYQVKRDRALSRRVLELDVVAVSVDLLDQVLASSPKAVTMVEGAYMAASRSVEKRFGESVGLGWTVCEQLISLAWHRLLDSKKVSGEANTMTVKRIEKLTGRGAGAQRIALERSLWLARGRAEGSQCVGPFDEDAERKRRVRLHVGCPCTVQATARD